VIQFLAALTLAATWPVDPVGMRVAASSRAAQSLQGPLDGAWALVDAKGERLLRLQIIDPPGGGRLSAAWRKPEFSVGAGYVDDIERGPSRLVLRLGGHDHRGGTVIRLRGRGSRYFGKMVVDAKSYTVTLTRDH
jgi:hypothetical protein